MVDVAITFDVERDKTVQKVMPKVVEILERYDGVGTWFVKHDYTSRFTNYTGSVLEDYPEVVASLADVGEVAPHIHFRADDGTFSMDESVQRALLEDATTAFREQGYDVTSFRGGNLAADETTLSILESMNYEVDSTVLPGHYRELPDNVVVDHRGRTSHQPYVPNRTSHTAVGDMNLTEVPVSGLSPVDGVSVSKSLTGVFNRLGGQSLVESMVVPAYVIWGRVAKAPVVLLFHDHEFSQEDESLEAFEGLVRDISRSRFTEFNTIGEIAETD